MSHTDTPPRFLDSAAHSSAARSGLIIDWQAYQPLLDDIEIPDDQKQALIETLWSIVITFVDLGFEVDHRIGDDLLCGQSDDALSDDPPDLLSLFDEERMSYLADRLAHAKNLSDIAGEGHTNDTFR